MNNFEDIGSNNFEVIARNMCYVYEKLLTKYSPDFGYDEREMFLSAATIDLLIYIKNKQITLEQLEDAYTLATKGMIGTNKIQIELDNSTLFVSYIMNIEVLIFLIEESTFSINTIIETVINEKNAIEAVVDLIHDNILFDNIASLEFDKKIVDYIADLMNSNPFFNIYDEDCTNVKASVDLGTNEIKIAKDFATTDTIPQAYAILYLHKNRNTDIVKEVFFRFGSIIKIGSLIGQKAIQQSMKPIGFEDFDFDDNLTDKKIINLLTDFFLTSKEL